MANSGWRRNMTRWLQEYRKERDCIRVTRSFVFQSTSEEVFDEVIDNQFESPVMHYNMIECENENMMFKK